MSESIPVGQRESQRLELKARESLRDPRAIAREVVAMLNSGGGSIWIGVPEVDGVASLPEPVPNASQLRQVLLDQLIDRIQPPIRPQEVDIVVVPIDAGAGVLRIDIDENAGSRGLFAYSDKGMLGFVQRVDHRIVPLAFSEIVGRLVPQERPEVRAQRAHERLTELRDEARSVSGDASIFVGLVVEPGTFAPRDTFDDTQRTWWRDLIGSSSKSTAPFWRWSKLGYGLEPTVPAKYLEATRRSSSGVATQMRAFLDGGFVLVKETAQLTWNDERASPAERRQLHPYYVLGTLGAFCELAASWLGQLGVARGAAHLQLEIGGMQGICLRAHSPTSYEWEFRDDETLRRFNEDVLTLSDPMRVDIESLVQSPGSVAIRLAEHVYNAFGFELEQLPREVDRAHQRIKLPD
jgi:hypothetical protein